MRIHQPLQERFWKYVDKTDGCWLWTGHRFKNGYGMTSDRDETLLAHRVSWELAYGPVPDGLNVLHHCDVPNCVRPDHLFLGTQGDNVQDMINKGRAKFSFLPAKCGSDNPSSKLTEDDVRLIRQKYIPNEYGAPRLAKEFGVSYQVIQRIIKRQAWKWLA